MQALIVDDVYAAQAEHAAALAGSGFQTMCVNSVDGALGFIRALPVDLLVMRERVNGQLTHPVSLSAERRNKGLATLIFTDRCAPDADELFDLLPSVSALLPGSAGGEIVAQFAVAALGQRTARRRARVQPNGSACFATGRNTQPIMPGAHGLAAGPIPGLAIAV